MSLLSNSTLSLPAPQHTFEKRYLVPYMPNTYFDAYDVIYWVCCTLVLVFFANRTHRVLLIDL